MNELERLARLETRADYTDRILDERKLVISAHSRRLADAEQNIHDLIRVQMDNVERITTVEQQSQNTSEERRDEKIAKRQRRAMMQWAVSVIVGMAALVGILGRAEMAHIKGLIGTFLSHPS